MMRMLVFGVWIFLLLKKFNVYKRYGEIFNLAMSVCVCILRYLRMKNDLDVVIVIKICVYFVFWVNILHCFTQ